MEHVNNGVLFAGCFNLSKRGIITAFTAAAPFLCLTSDT